MASIKSLGIHKLSALPWLVAEGILPPNPPDTSYTWQTVPGDEGVEDIEEELVTTSSCVVWSRGGIIQRTFRFEVEGEDVVQAVFTRFSTQHGRNIAKPANNNVSLQEKQAALRPEQVLHIRKQRSTQSQDPSMGARVESSFNKDPPNLWSRHPTQSAPQLDRALVVVLKTQAHVYFLSGTSHIVHLPFEVGAIFPLVRGVLLQRKVAGESHEKPTPFLPSAPYNSFAFSQPASSGSAQYSQPLHNVTSGAPDETMKPFAALFESLMERTKHQNEIKLPGHFCLTDPLTEMGVVVERSFSNYRFNVREKHQKPALMMTKELDASEKILYMSSKDELTSTTACPDDPQLLLSLTVNKETGAYSLWTVTYVEPTMYKKQERRESSGSGTKSRRRSSYGPGTGTGTTTPGVRMSMGARESFGGVKEAVIEKSLVYDDVDLASQLDPAFENPAVPAKSSRRVSSLLARSDLSTGRDMSAFTDLATSGTIRRGLSFGGHGIRSSLGPTGGHNTNRRMVSDPYKAPVDSFLEIPLNRMSEDFDSDDSMTINGTSRDCGAVQGLRKEMMFTKVPGKHATKGFHTSSQASRKLTRQPSVFTLKRATSEDPSKILTVMCVMDYENRCLSVLQVRAEKRNAPMSTSTQFEDHLDVEVLEFGSGNNIIDACRVSDGTYSRILVLGESDDGFGELTLQAPWSRLFQIHLPENLLIHHPYQVAHTSRSRSKHQGGLRRVLSQGPAALNGLEHSTGGNQVDIVDQDGSRHRISIQLEPSSTLLVNLIRVCEFVLPRHHSEREPISRAWWDATSWLRARSHPPESIEWTAFVVVIFSLFVGSLETQHPPSPFPTKRHKAGLLRSSSGAGLDLENWEAMLRYEGDSCESSPSFRQDPAWDWATESDGTLQSSKSPQTRSSRSTRSSTSTPHSLVKKSTFLIDCAQLAREFVASPAGLSALGEQGYLPSATSKNIQSSHFVLPAVLIGLHLYREELKLNLLASDELHTLTPVLAQMGGWLDWEDWGWRGSTFYMLENAAMNHWVFDDCRLINSRKICQIMQPPSILAFLEGDHDGVSNLGFPTLEDVVSSSNPHRVHEPNFSDNEKPLTPMTALIIEVLKTKSDPDLDRVAAIAKLGVNGLILDQLPESIAAPLRSVISACQTNPATTWTTATLALVDRDDISMLEKFDKIRTPQIKVFGTPTHEALRDVHGICNSTLDIDSVGSFDGSAEADRQAVTRMIFKEDQRFAEAAKMVHPTKHATARCAAELDWSDTDLLEAQQELVKVIAIRTLSVSPGRGMLFYNARFPLLTEKLPMHGFSLACVMKPSNTTVTADKGMFSEEKVSWAFFHAGVGAGLSISKNAKGVDTSWILFNKPSELNNRHAGFLLALGLNGHLKSIAKWVAFKYLTPKHTMTSIGLLLGLSASYLGTMDTLITRLLSIHVTRMLPRGAAELNLSPLTQTTGIMAIGLLYCNTQHRRMSEIMLSEMENTDQDDNLSPMENLRDEGYRLAAGFALGYINVGQGKNLRGLRDMYVVERLLALAVGTRKVDLVHILDKATAAATIAVGLIFMKTEDEALARKIDIPDTVHQFEYVRPDIFLLRTVARHLILWSKISPTTSWIRKQLPISYQPRAKLNTIRSLRTEDLPLFNIVAGLCLSIGLRYAGTAREDVRNLLGHYLDQFIRICRLPALNYDGKLTRITTRNCQDTIALAAASVMAGTGDLYILRRLRFLHGRTDADTPYGSHLAAHQAIGVLFLGGGTHTFNTSNIAIASLLCAFYPLFPTTVLDNKSHLQAFRHFWVLAAEPRCLIVRDVDTHRPISLPIIITLRSGAELEATAPCLLPELDSIANIQTNDPHYWRVTLDFAKNPAHMPAFKRHQSIYVSRRGAYDAHSSTFSATMQALNDTQLSHQLNKQGLEWVFQLPSLQIFDRAEKALVLPGHNSPLPHHGTRSTIVDDRLMLERGSLESRRAERLWNLRVLFAWAEAVKKQHGKINWLGTEAIDRLKAAVNLKGSEHNKEG